MIDWDPALQPIEGLFAGALSHREDAARVNWRSLPRAAEYGGTLVLTERECLDRALGEVPGDSQLRAAAPVRFAGVLAGVPRSELPATARPAAAKLVGNPEPIDQVAGAIRRSTTTALVCR
jgi:hypothetical protein